MRKYELVVLINGRTSQEDIDKALENVTSQLPDQAILATDVIGKKTMMYDFGGKTGNNVMYTVSYYLQLDPAAVAEIKKSFTYIDNLERYFFYSMADDQPFFTMKELEKHFTELFEEEKDEASEEETEE